MSLASLIVIILLIVLIMYFIISYDKIVAELKEIRTKCIKINNLSNNDKKENFELKSYISYKDRGWNKKSKNKK